MYDGFDGLESQIEDQEKEAAELNRREEQAETRTAKLESAVSRLEGDARVCTLLNEKREQAEEEKERTSEAKRECADRLLDVENQLRELAEETDNEAAVIAELREMGEDVSASEAVIQQKKDWIMACQQKTEMIAEILGLNIGSLDFEASEGEGVYGEKENKEMENVSEGKESSDSRRAKFLADLKYDPPLHKNGTEDSGTGSDSDDVDRGQRELERTKDTAGRQKGRDDEERMDMSAVSGFKDTGIIYREIDEDIGEDAIYPDIILFCYPNDAGEETAGSPFTRLVIEGRIRGETYWYPITINRGDFGIASGGDGRGIGRNMMYSYDITIRRTGTKDPDIPVSLEDVTISCPVEPWEDIDSGTVSF